MTMVNVIFIKRYLSHYRIKRLKYLEIILNPTYINKNYRRKYLFNVMLKYLFHIVPYLLSLRISRKLFRLWLIWKYVFMKFKNDLIISSWYTIYFLKNVLDTLYILSQSIIWNLLHTSFLNIILFSLSNKAM